MCCGVHATGYTVADPKKMQEETCSPTFCGAPATNSERRWEVTFLRLFMLGLRSHMREKLPMKPSLILLVVLLLLLNTLATCAPRPNPSKGTAMNHDGVAGFWLGLWQGLIAPFVFVASLFRRDLSIYEIHNNGAWYNFGYLF